MKDGFHYENKAFFVVTGIRTDDCWMIFGIRFAEIEEPLFWKIFSMT